MVDIGVTREAHFIPAFQLHGLLGVFEGNEKKPRRRGGIRRGLEHGGINRTETGWGKVSQCTDNAELQVLSHASHIS